MLGMCIFEHTTLIAVKVLTTACASTPNTAVPVIHAEQFRIATMTTQALKTAVEPISSPFGYTTAFECIIPVLIRGDVV